MGEVRYTDVHSDSDSVFWVERRPSEHGRGVLVRRSNGKCDDVTPPELSVGTRVYEYGGASYAVSGNAVVFSSRPDDTVWMLDFAGNRLPRLLCNDGKRYADFVFDHAHQRLIAVCEEHRPSGVVNNLVAISLADGSTTVLAEGRDFYAAPAISPDGGSLCWLTWSSRAMPWEWTELWTAEISADGRASNQKKVYGSDKESLLQPQWSPEGDLYVISDRDNWWNLYRVQDGVLIPVLNIEEECASRPWVLGLRSYHFFGNHQVAILSQRNSVVSLHQVDLGGGEVHSQSLPLTSFSGTSALAGGEIFAVGGSHDRSATVVSVDLGSGSVTPVVSSAGPPDAAWHSIARTLRFTNRTGDSLTAFLYAPKNSDCDSDGELPPLLVRVHGGPTGQWAVDYSRQTQFWTTRGFAVLDVDYTGSSGYGRAQRQALRGRWGVADVCDCIDAAQAVARSGQADAQRLLITGGSSGGFTVLCALAFHPGTFAAAASYYGVADMRMLAESTHKFEAGYDAFLFGTLNHDDPVYRERSPLLAVDRITDPLIVFQGNDDAVVPPSQAHAIVDALKSRGARCEAYFFDNEGHGFNDAGNIAKALEAELAFYRSVLRITAT
jgi:dipeptidyl aminopeptidase/acylaminoacyl peptidase